MTNIFTKTVCLVAAATLGLMAPGQSTWAAEADTYNVRVDLTSRSLADRRTGAQAGLRAVLTRLTGQLDLPSSPALRRALNTPEDYYTRFRYLRTQRYDDLGTPIVVLALRFSPTAVRDLMSAAQLPLWTLNRPSVVAWVSVNGPGGATLINDPKHPVIATLRKRAKFRGLPLVLPALDAQDLSLVSTRDIARPNEAKLLGASKRYGGQMVLAGRAEQIDTDNWRVRWTSWVDGNPQQLSLNGSPSNVAFAPVDRVTDALVSRFTVAGGALGTLRLQVSAIDSVADYGGVLRYLEGLSYVDNVTLVGVNSGGLELDVATSSSAAKFMELLAIESRLQQAPSRFDPRGGLGSGRGGVSSSNPTPEPVSVPFASQVLRVAWQG